MRTSLGSEVARARQLQAESRELYARLNGVVEGLRAEIARSDRRTLQLRSATEPTIPGSAADARADAGSTRDDTAARPDGPGRAAATPPSYTVYLEGGSFTHAKRSSATRRFERSLEAHYGSAAGVVAAMSAVEPSAVERWRTATLYARWSSIAPHEFGGPGAFVVRRGPAFESG